MSISRGHNNIPHITVTITMDSPASQPDEPQQPVAGSPSDFLKNIVGKKVKVRIGSGIDYHGELAPSRTHWIWRKTHPTRCRTGHAGCAYWH